jgi:hypothetical protein
MYEGKTRWMPINECSELAQKPIDSHKNLSPFLNDLMAICFHTSNFKYIAGFKSEQFTCRGKNSMKATVSFKGFKGTRENISSNRGGKSH